MLGRSTHLAGVGDIGVGDLHTRRIGATGLAGTTAVPANRYGIRRHAALSRRGGAALEVPRRLEIHPAASAHGGGGGIAGAAVVTELAGPGARRSVCARHGGAAGEHRENQQLQGQHGRQGDAGGGLHIESGQLRHHMSDSLVLR